MGKPSVKEYGSVDEILDEIVDLLWKGDHSAIECVEGSF